MPKKIRILNWSREEEGLEVFANPEMRRQEVFGSRDPKFGGEAETYPYFFTAVQVWKNQCFKPQEY